MWVVGQLFFYVNFLHDIQPFNSISLWLSRYVVILVWWVTLPCYLWKGDHLVQGIVLDVGFVSNLFSIGTRNRQVLIHILSSQAHKLQAYKINTNPLLITTFRTLKSLP